MRIRSAQPGDAVAVLALAEAFYTEGAFATKPDELATNLPILLDSDTVRVAVALEGAAPVGFAITTVSFGLEHGRIAILEDLYVTPGQRRHGIGTALIDDSAHWAATLGCRHLELVVAPNGQEVGHLFTYYTRLGFLDDGRRLLSRPLESARR
ncbi:GNAT family N-acetyltransferase [Actinophytocola sp.]|uniref:GNAT family N-acetyltransferase n=1 Tax=Actinophytocola sp. TaxID=1872138 RepID=UPI002D7E845C|nr:GNAT family N-acetyltransferase [Actinophytocola sp.]HET9143106.1 GNAT family N-acetyltransferase [Actinophytocola sp.]